MDLFPNTAPPDNRTAPCLRQMDLMEYLILNILFSSCFILCVKWVQGRPSMDTVTVGAVNYLAAAICALPGFLNSTPSEQVVHACWTGAAMGGCYFSAFFFCSTPSTGSEPPSLLPCPAFHWSYRLQRASGFGVNGRTVSRWRGS